MTLLRINNRILKKNGIVLTGTAGEPPAPVLPPYTIRLKFTEGVTPTLSKGTGVQVSSSPNIWDLTYTIKNWISLCSGQSDLIEVIGANTTDVTNMSDMFINCSALTTVSLFDTSSVTNTSYMFSSCSSLTSVPLFNTSSVTNMNYMFNKCSSLTTVPLFNTSNVTNMTRMFSNCTNVQSGALALYQQASAQATPPTKHSYTFYKCGRDTTTGAAELAQIPTSWGGTMN